MISKETIMESAFAIFARNGIKGVSMDDIAKELKISKKTLYGYFSGKQQLSYQTFEYKYSALLDRIEKIVTCVPNPLVAFVFSVVENIRFSCAIETESLKEIRENEYLRPFFYSAKPRVDSLSKELMDRVVENGYIQSSKSNEIVIALLKEQLKDVHSFREAEVFPTALCLDTVITILMGVCTPAGREVLEELKTNYT